MRMRRILPGDRAPIFRTFRRIVPQAGAGEGSAGPMHMHKDSHAAQPQEIPYWTPPSDFIDSGFDSIGYRRR